MTKKESNKSFSNMLSLFQSASGTWHVPSILMASSWLGGTIIAGIFMFANLRVNRNDRLKAYEKERLSILAANEARAKIDELEEKARPRSLSADQKKSVCAQVQVFAGLEYDIIWFNDDAESLHLAEDIFATLKAAEWTIKPSKSALGFAVILGVIVEYPQAMADTLEEPAKTLTNALIASNLESKIVSVTPETGLTDRIRIKVGKKR